MTLFKFVLLNMLSVVLLGTGNIAHHILQAFTCSDKVEIRQVYGRNKEALLTFKEYAPITSDFDAIAKADIYILALSDSAIGNVSKKLSDKKGLVAHTSGSVAMSALQTKRKGVFYPLQSFTKGKPVSFSEIPICIEANFEKDLSKLEALGRSISGEVHHISSEQRKKLHLSAVLVNNFPNHLYAIAQELCIKNDISFDLLYPLISETVNKIRFLSPFEAQTGPAIRDDTSTMQHHLEQLNNPLHKKIYQLMSESIKKSYEEEL